MVVAVPVEMVEVNVLVVHVAVAVFVAVTVELIVTVVEIVDVHRGSGKWLEQKLIAGG
jgi:hypothetical protein